MRSTVFWSFLSLVTLATGGLISGCDSDAKIRKSAEGESCDGTADCNDGLKCIQGACYKSGGGGNEGGEGNGTGGTTAGPPAPVLSGEGESCAKRADCEDGLACFNQRCVVAETGEGGGANLPEVRLGATGETCTVTSDCEEGLSCIPGGYVYGQGAPIGFIGVCGSSTYVEPTGKTCAAECVEAADCCELPLLVHPSIGAESCAELDVQLEGVNCASAAITELNKQKCFARDVYCDCADDAWTCDEGACTYALGCDALEGSYLTADGCPPYTRSGRGLSSCNADSECAPDPDAVAVCETDDDCDLAPITDIALTNCGEGECTCYQETGCYRKCDEDSDCAPGRVCDTAASVCVAAVTCETDQQCAIKMNNPRYTCDEESNTCQLTCTNDYDCNGGTFAGGINTLVCGPEKTCVPVGCSTHADCSSGPNLTGVQMFCTDVQPVAVPGAPSSAITG